MSKRPAAPVVGPISEPLVRSVSYRAALQYTHCQIERSVQGVTYA
jgi:hypothetical protein